MTPITPPANKAMDRAREASGRSRGRARRDPARGYPPPGEVGETRHDVQKPIGPAPFTRSSAKGDLHRLQGKVVSSDTGRPEEGVQVSVSNRSKAGTTLDHVAVTDAAGKYAFTLPDGDWTVNVKMPSGRVYAVSHLTVSAGQIHDDIGARHPHAHDQPLRAIDAVEPDPRPPGCKGGGASGPRARHRRCYGTAPPPRLLPGGLFPPVRERCGTAAQRAEGARAGPSRPHGPRRHPRDARGSGDDEVVRRHPGVHRAGSGRRSGVRCSRRRSF